MMSKATTSERQKFCENSFLFLKAKHAQFQLVDWKQVAFLIKHSKSNASIKTSIFSFSTVRLKFPISKIFSYLLEFLVEVNDTLSRKYFSFCKEG